MGAKIQVTIGKITCSTVLDLGSSVCAIPKSLYDTLNISPMENATLVYYLLILLPSML